MRVRRDNGFSVLQRATGALRALAVDGRRIPVGSLRRGGLSARSGRVPLTVGGFRSDR